AKSFTSGGTSFSQAADRRKGAKAQQPSRDNLGTRRSKFGSGKGSGRFEGGGGRHGRLGSHAVRKRADQRAAVVARAVSGLVAGGNGSAHRPGKGDARIASADSRSSLSTRRSDQVR